VNRVQRPRAARRYLLRLRKPVRYHHLMSRTPWYMRKGHGTEARARRHYRDGEKPCEACRQAVNQARKNRGYKPGEAELRSPEGR